MMKLSCTDLNPSSECRYEATGENAKEVAVKMMAHAKAEHPEDIEKMGMDDTAMRAMFETKVHE